MGQLPSAKDTVASDTTTSAAYEDVDGLTVQLTVDDLSDVLLMASVQARGSVTALAGWRLVFDGTPYLEQERTVGSEPANISFFDRVVGKGAGTYTFKLQHKVGSGTLTTENAIIVAVSLHSGNGAVPANSVYVATDTVGNAWEDIPGLTADVTLSKTSHIVAFLCWHGSHSSNNKDGFSLINIDGTDGPIHARNFDPSGAVGQVFHVNRTTAQKTAGVYTVKARWKGAGGSTLTGNDFTLVIIAGEANSGAEHIDIKQVLVATDTTTATALEDVDGLSVTPSPEETAHVLAAMCLRSDVSVANTSAYTTVSVNAVDHDVMERGHVSAQREGSVGQFVRTDSPLSAGDYTVKGRWYTDSGNTLTGDNIELISIVLAATAAVIPLVVAGTVTSGGELTRLISKTTPAGALTPGGALLKQAQANWEGTLTSSGALTLSRVYALIASGALSFLGTLAQLPRKALGGTLTSAGVLSRKTAASFSGGLTFAGALLKKTSIFLFGILGALGELFFKDLAGTLSFVGGISTLKTTALALVAALTSSGAITRKAAKSLDGALSFTGLISKVTPRQFIGSLSFVGDLTAIKVIVLGIAGTLSFAGAISRSVSKVLAGEVTPSGQLVKKTLKVLTGGLSFVGDLLIRRVVLLAVSGTLSFAGVLTREAAKTLAGSLDSTGALTKQTTRTLAGAVTPSGALTRRTGKVMSGALSFAGALGRTTGKALAAGLSFLGALTKKTSKPLTAALSFVGDLTIQLVVGLGGVIGKIKSAVLDVGGVDFEEPDKGGASFRERDQGEVK